VLHAAVPDASYDMAYTRFIVACLVLAAIMAGLVMSLVGPAWGVFVSTTAFVVTVGLFIGLGVRNRPFTAVIPPDRPSRRYQLPLRIAAGACLSVFGGALVTHLVASGGDGVAEGTPPILASRESYRLNNHGVYTPVTRTRYVVVGAAFVVGWHALGTAFALLVLDLSLFGPWRSDE